MRALAALAALAALIAVGLIPVIGFRDGHELNNPLLWTANASHGLLRQAGKIRLATYLLVKDIQKDEIDAQIHNRSETESFGKFAVLWRKCHNTGHYRMFKRWRRQQTPVQKMISEIMTVARNTPRSKNFVQTGVNEDRSAVTLTIYIDNAPLAWIAFNREHLGELIGGLQADLDSLKK